MRSWMLKLEARVIALEKAVLAMREGIPLDEYIAAQVEKAEPFKPENKPFEPEVKRGPGRPPNK